jgi:hypothetical protein
MAQTSEPSWGSTALKVAGITGATIAAACVVPPILTNIGSAIGPVAGETAPTALEYLGKSLETAGNWMGNNVTSTIADIAFTNPPAADLTTFEGVGTLAGQAWEDVAKRTGEIVEHLGKDYTAAGVAVGVGAAGGYALRQAEGFKRPPTPPVPPVGTYTARLQEAASRPLSVASAATASR